MAGQAAGGRPSGCAQAFGASRDQGAGALSGEQVAFVAVEGCGEVGALIRGVGLGEHLVAPLLGCQGGLGTSGQLAHQGRDQVFSPFARRPFGGRLPPPLYDARAAALIGRCEFADQRDPPLTSVGCGLPGVRKCSGGLEGPVTSDESPGGAAAAMPKLVSGGAVGADVCCVVRELASMPYEVAAATRKFIRKRGKNLDRRIVREDIRAGRRELQL